MKAKTCIKAQIWNRVPDHIVSAPMLQSFKRQLKTFLLQQFLCLERYSGLAVISVTWATLKIND